MKLYPQYKEELGVRLTDNEEKLEWRTRFANLTSSVPDLDA